MKHKVVTTSAMALTGAGRRSALPSVFLTAMVPALPETLPNALMARAASQNFGLSCVPANKPSAGATAHAEMLRPGCLASYSPLVFASVDSQRDMLPASRLFSTRFQVLITKELRGDADFKFSKSGERRLQDYSVHT
jgi:hypothetical protein